MNNSFDTQVQCEEIYREDLELRKLYEEMEQCGDKSTDSTPPTAEAIEEMAQAANNFFNFTERMFAPRHK